MGNNSIMLEIKEWMESLGLSPASIFLMAFLIIIFFILIFILIALILRKARLWYWKIDVQLETLQSIDSWLKQVEEADVEQKRELAGSFCEEQPANGNCLDAQEIKEKIGTETAKEPLQNSSESFIGKSGKVYTEKELELQIRD